MNIQVNVIEKITKRGEILMYKNLYNHPYVYSNIYQNPYIRYSNIYQNPYNYPSQYPYNLYQHQPIEHYYIRDPKFADLIGQYYTTSKPVTLPTGYTIPANTRIFIHNVIITSTGEELVTIVAPIQKDGTTVNESIKDIPANQL